MLENILEAEMDEHLGRYKYQTLIRKPQILILDESTSSLDMISRKNLYEYINTNKKDFLTFIISHDDNLNFDYEIKLSR